MSDYQTDKATEEYITRLGQRGMMRPEMVASLLKNTSYSERLGPKYALDYKYKEGEYVKKAGEEIRDQLIAKVAEILKESFDAKPYLEKIIEIGNRGWKGIPVTMEDAVEEFGGTGSKEVRKALFHNPLGNVSSVDSQKAMRASKGEGSAAASRVLVRTAKKFGVNPSRLRRWFSSPGQGTNMQIMKAVKLSKKVIS